MDPVYNCQQVAERYGVTLKTVWVWIREKRLGAVKAGKSYAVRQSDLEAFEAANATRKEAE